MSYARLFIQEPVCEGRITFCQRSREERRRQWCYWLPLIIKFLPERQGNEYLSHKQGFVFLNSDKTLPHPLIINGRACGVWQEEQSEACVSPELMDLWRLCSGRRDPMQEGMGGTGETEPLQSRAQLLACQVPVSKGLPPCSPLQVPLQALPSPVTPSLGKILCYGGAHWGLTAPSTAQHCLHSRAPSSQHSTMSWAGQRAFHGWRGPPSTARLRLQPYRHTQAFVGNETKSFGS